MTRLPDPLRKNPERAESPLRILSDRGIRKALEEGFIRTEPSFDPEQEPERIQPASLDVKLAQIEGSEPIGFLEGGFLSGWRKENCLPAGRLATVELTELIDGMLPFFSVRNEARSSLRRSTALSQP